MSESLFVRLFSDELNDLDIAYDMLCLGMSGSFGARVDFKYRHSESAGKWAGWHVSAESLLSWGNGWSSYSSTGKIEWYTSSGHYARFEFSRTGDPPPYRGEIRLARVVIGNDPSENFYLCLKDTCVSHGIPVEVEAEEGE